TKAEPLSNPDEPLVVTVNAKGEIYLQETSITDDALVPRLQAITANKPDTKIFVRGDKAIDYGRVMQVMGMIKSAGFTQVALVVNIPRDKPTAPKKDKKKKTGKKANARRLDPFFVFPWGDRAAARPGPPRSFPLGRQGDRAGAGAACDRGRSALGAEARRYS